MPPEQPLAVRLGAARRATLRDFAKKLAPELFPGPAIDQRELRGEAEHAYIRATWGDARSRMQLLNRLAPPRPDGLPEPEGAARFLRKVLAAHGWDEPSIGTYLKQVSEGAAALPVVPAPPTPPGPPTPPTGPSGST